MPSTIEAPLARDAFEAALLATVDLYPFEDTRFFRLLDSGRCPDSVLRRYARSTYVSAKTFCASLAELIEKAPDKEAQLILLENLLGEEGMFLSPRRGLVSRPETRHPALALRFVRACGGGEAADEHGLEGDGLHTTVPGRTMLAEGRWLEAVAFILVGQELKFSETAVLLFGALRRHGFATRDLAFFAAHIEADRSHGRQALDLVIDRALTADAQRRCLRAAGDGARHWFEMHGNGAGLRRAA